MARDRVEQTFAAVEADLAEERVSTLAKAGRKVEAAIAECDRLAALLPAHPSDGDEALVSYRSARKAFDDALWAYCVHREAIGLWDHRWVHRTWPRPPKR